MMAYSYLNKNNKHTYVMIEHFVKESKTHIDIGDQEKGFIQKVILDGISLWCNVILSRMTVWMIW